MAAVIRRGDACLVALRPAHKRHGGCWEFPGGKLDPGETLLDAARREMREELGVECRAVGAPLHRVRDPGSPFVIEFTPADIEGEPRPLEHERLAWADPAELEDFDLAPADRAFVEWLLEEAADG